MRDDEGVWELLTFARPVVDLDNSDEDFTKHKAPPRIVVEPQVVERITTVTYPDGRVERYVNTPPPPSESATYLSPMIPRVLMEAIESL